MDSASTNAAAATNHNAQAGVNRPGQNPITSEVIISKLSAIPNLVDKDITRTAFSTLISEYKDYAVGILDPAGKLIAQCRGGLPIFIANALSAAVQDGLQIYGQDRLQHGDVVITNYAGTMGQHLNNVVMYTPIRLSDDEDGLIGFSAVVMHWMDVGGMIVGSCFSNDASDIFQEGIQFHTMKLHSRGEPVEEMYRLIRCNTRFPEMVLGDLESQTAGCLMGRDMVQEIAEEFGTDEINAAVHRFWDRSERSTRALIQTIPDGTYRAKSFLDEDPQAPGTPIPVEVAVVIDGDQITIDLSGLAPQAKGPINAGFAGGAVAAARIACKYLFSPEEPANEGAFRPITVHCPPGRFLSADPTAAMGGSGSTIPTVVDTILRAMASALPDRVPAGHHGTYCLHVLYGRHGENGDFFQHMESAVGGWGASLNEDGAGPFRSMAHGDTLEVPIELQEANHPYRLEYVRLRRDSGGPGAHRGGLGVEKCYEMLGDARVGVRIDRTSYPSWGIDGGQPGKTGAVEVHRASQPPETITKGDVALSPGDRVKLFSGGGGGYGDPRSRNRESITADLRAGYISEASARSHYGLTD